MKSSRVQLVVLTGLLAATAARAAACLFGTLGSEPQNAARNFAAGMRLATVSLAWDRYEPEQDRFAAAYVAHMREQIAAFRQAGLKIVLDLGVQYPPRWLFALPAARYVNQYGDAFADGTPGMNGLNVVFNAAARARQARYVEQVFRDFGTDWFAVRLGGGWFGELNFPPHNFHNHANCYWAFDDLAQGRKPGLPSGVRPCPVPGWKPGETEHAHVFLDWYLDSLQNYHDWQIATARQWYRGALMMLYPSWGIRPGQIAAAVAGNLNGSTSAELNGEIQRGFDWARFVAGIHDQGVMVHTTWLDAPADDESPNPERWSPVHFLASLARKQSLTLSAENTGGGDLATLRLCFDRVRRYQCATFLWAFEQQLFDGHSPELADCEREIGAGLK